MDATLYVLLSVTHIFPFKKDFLCVTTLVQLFPHFCFNIMKLKYKCYQCFHENQLLKCRGTSKYKFCYFQKRALRSKATRIVAENLTNSTTSGKCRNIARLIEIRYDELVTFHNISYLQNRPSAPCSCVFFSRKQLQKTGRIVIPDKFSDGQKLCRRSCNLNDI